MKKNLLIGLLILGPLGLVSAQITPFTEKLWLNAELNSQGLSTGSENEGTDRGGGLGLRVGYGFTPTFSLYLGFTGADMRPGNDRNQTYGLGIAELGTRLHFGKKLKSPTFYLDISFQSTETRADEPEISFAGGGLGIGGGLLVYVGRKLALDLGLRGTGGNFSEFHIGDQSVNIDEENIRYGVGRLSVGLTWFPFRD
ncbi:outer membrane beta-barrel protein [Flavilitoribacter nigricans]|nr:outer membrane beta-barrel protein [Flavilitoribacter nigricans]